MKDADLRGAQFMEAKMQGAHLEGAHLEGADFTRANLADTYFTGSHFDQSALRSIALGALGWRDKSHFDPAVKHDLELLAADQGHDPEHFMIVKTTGANVPPNSSGSQPRA
jgi:uncharacterized protein YjbI with pentapeptide repeats